MPARLCLIACLAAMWAAIPLQAEESAPPAPEAEANIINWVEGVGVDFLSAAAEGDVSQAEALVGATLKDAYNYSQYPHRLREWLTSSIAIRRLGKARIKERELSPNKGEVVFQGEFVNEDRATPFTLRLAKDPSTERWQVSFFRLQSVPPVIPREANVRDVPASAIPNRPVITRKSRAETLLGKVPSKFNVYVVAAGDGKKELDVYLDSPENPTYLNEVVVNKPGEDVVLILTARSSTIWRIGRTPETRLAGVLLTGNGGQAAVGLERDCPLVVSTTHKRGIFTPFFVSDITRDAAHVENVVRMQLGQGPADLIHLSEDNTFWVGAKPGSDEKVVYSDHTTVKDVSKPLLVARAEKGLEQLLAEKKIRRAKATDIAAWVAAAERDTKALGPDLRVQHRLNPDRAYVVLQETTVPAGLTGAHSVAFIIPDGMPAPTGPRGHCDFYFMDGTRVGP